MSFPFNDNNNEIDFIEQQISEQHQRASSPPELVPKEAKKGSYEESGHGSRYGSKAKSPRDKPRPEDVGNNEGGLI